MARLDIYATDRVKEFFQLFLVLQTIQHCTVYGSTVESHNQAFIQTDKHLTYIVGDNYINSGVPLEIKPGSSFPDLTLQDDNFFSNNIRLDPPMLDFQDQPVGMPRMEKVIVQNNDPKHSLHLLSISGSTVHFHCSFFQDKIVPPGGNTSFDVVFLARQVGNVENTLFIHTSIGSIRYQVFGVGIPNPYRLRPYLGARVPINSSFTPVIQMHNPYSTSLQVLEMFASEGDLHLELPSGEREASQELWELKPFETKAVMKASFVARVESNHSAFIRIKTNKEEQRDGASELLILPFEIEVSSDPGIYSPVELLDFGILRTLDEPKTLRLNLINTGPKAIHITSVNVSPPNNAVSVDFRPFKLQPDGSRPTTVAHITFRAVKALQSKQWSGKIVIKTKNNIQRLVIPYQANVLHGSLVYNVNTTHFFSAKALWNVTRPMAFTNTFNFSVVIYNVSLPSEVSSYFTIVNFSKPVILQPQQSLAAFLLKFHPNLTQIHFSTVLTVSTNASTFSIPIIVYNGLMKVIHHRPEKFEGQLDFGTLGVGETRSMIFTIRNDNPVDIVVARFETNMTWASVEILGMEKGNGTTLTRKHNQSEINTDPLYIKPYHYAVFNVSIVAPGEEGAYVADIWMFTQFQDLFIPITFRAAEGSLHAIPDKFIFEKVYPGRVPFKVLQIHSTFDDYMEVTQVTFQPADTRFYFVPQNSNTVLLQPHEHSIVGKIYFNAKSDCKDDCYVGLPTLSPAGHQWLLGMSLDKDVADTDQYLYTKLQQKWERLESLQQNIANVTIELDTNQVRGFLFSAQAHLQWPSLIKKSRIKYPLTQIGNLTVSDFIVENPGDEPVLVQVLPLSLYPNPHTILDLMSHRLAEDLTEYVDTEDSSAFLLYDLELIGKGGGTASANNLAQHRKTVESTLGVIPHKHTLAALLQPGTKIKVKVGFQPKDDLARSSLIVIRNNLTIIDAVVVQGQGRKGEMRFNNKKPGSHSALTFEMTEKHLKNCDTSEKKANKNIMPNFTVRRPFTLRNSGELPFYIHGFSINDLPCEGYGFKVLDCSGFEMPPNSSRKINIAFTPDFTMSQIQRSLTIHTSLGPPAAAANYSLQAMVPYDLLSQCSAALPRPSWEPLLYYFVVCLMAFIVCCILVLAYFESDRVMAEYIRRKLKVSNGTQTFEKGKVFDLRSITGLAAGGVASTSQANAAAVKAGFSAPNQCANGRPAGDMNGHASELRDSGGLDNHLNHSNNIQKASAATLAAMSATTSTSSTNGSRNRRTFLGSLIKMIKSMSLVKYFNSSKKAPPPQQEKPVLKEAGTSLPTPVQRVSSAPSSKTPPALDASSNTMVAGSSTTTASSSSQESTAVLSEKSIPNNSNHFSNRGRKGRLNHRRQIVVEASGDTSSSGGGGSASTDHSSRKLKENKDPAPPAEAVAKKSSTAMMDDFDDIPMSKFTSSALDPSDDLEELDIKLETKSGKHRGGAKRNKSKNKPESKDRLLFRRESNLPDDADDVSSTTTESSGGDVEDKSSVGNDTTPEITTTTTTTNGRKWRKNGHKHTERLVVATHGGDIIDDDSNFEVTSKSKAHRKIRVNKETFGGDIMRPSTIELPYCLPTEKERAESDSHKRPKRSKKPAQKGDLSELSIQTETFAQKHNRVAGGTGGSNSVNASTASSLNSTSSPSALSGFGSGSVLGSSTFGFTPDRLSYAPGSGVSSRSNSSYSSIVSSSTNMTSAPTTPPPESLNPRGSSSSSAAMSLGSGPMLPGASGTAPASQATSVVGSPLDVHNSRYASAGFRPFSENGLPGIVPGLAPAQSSPPSTWASGLPPSTSGDASYGLHSISESGGPSGFGMSGHRGLDGYGYGSPGEVPPSMYSMYQGSAQDGLSSQPPQQQLTIMQQLQVERRRRLWEHQQKVNKGELWPGFDTPLIRHDSLWDNDCNPMEHNSWSTNTDNVTSPNGFWSTLTNSASSGWSSLQSLANIWGSPPQQDPSAGHGNFNQGSGSPQANQQPLVGGAAPPPFNPFTSMADIWSPTSATGSLGGMGGVSSTSTSCAMPGGGLGGMGGSPPLSSSPSPGAPGSLGGSPTSAQWNPMTPSPSAPGTPPISKEQQQQ
ncbi:transmembrane protein 131 isoform X2 [Aplysia californica]|uniref:Transmembrane protein 131 isoform X2 n=1 Tax=Aplysia californica TaxID=6500 RepID=A0ABM0JJT2_APLCA|nr:transmembrane protein 131 isoform X2 [Aplysia californica]